MSPLDVGGGRCAARGCALVDLLPREGMHFDCPVCHSSRFCLVFYELHDGRRMKASFYHCSACDFAFTHPDIFLKPQCQENLPYTNR